MTNPVLPEAELCCHLCKGAGCLTGLCNNIFFFEIQYIQGQLYRLNYPKEDVKRSFTSYLYEKTVKIKQKNINNRFTLLADLLAAENPAEFISTVITILASITYHQISGQAEAYFHTVFYSQKDRRIINEKAINGKFYDSFYHVSGIH